MAANYKTTHQINDLIDEFTDQVASNISDWERWFAWYPIRTNDSWCWCCNLYRKEIWKPTRKEGVNKITHNPFSFDSYEKIGYSYKTKKEYFEYILKVKNEK